MSHMENCIGVFDSGLGGLSVLRHLIQTMPQENMVYFGDTARVPYGARSNQAILRYVESDIRFLKTFPDLFYFTLGGFRRVLLCCLECFCAFTLPFLCLTLPFALHFAFFYAFAALYLSLFLLLSFAFSVPFLSLSPRLPFFCVLSYLR